MQTKSFTQGHPDMFGSPTPSDFELIKSFIKSEDITPNDLFVYPVRLCDNCKDRDGERFSDAALNSIAILSVGVVGIKNHDWSSEHAHSRIYKAAIEEVDGIKSVIGYAYTLVTNSTTEFINNIKSGLLAEVSIGFSAKGYSELDGIRVIEDVDDVFEWSFVAVPAQPKAGVVKNMSKEVNRMELEARIKELEAEVETKSLRVKELEDSVAVKDAKINELQTAIVENTLNAAVSSVKSAFKFKGAKAEEIAEGVIKEIISITEDGNVEGCEVAEQTIKEEYDFLYEEDEQIESKSADEEEAEGEAKESDEEEDKVEVKNYAVIAENIVKKSKKLDFTYVQNKK